MKWTWANQISILRILLILPFVIFMLSANEPEIGTVMRYLALAMFFVMGLSDALDGYVARRLQQATELGRFLDPLADKLLIVCAAFLLSMPATAVKGFRLPGEVVVLIIGKDILLSLGFVVVYFITGHVRIAPNRAGKSSTFLQIAMVLATLTAPELSKIINIWPTIVYILWALTAAAAVIATVLYIYEGIRYIDSFEKSQSN
jgi:cardiolipin synthase